MLVSIAPPLPPRAIILALLTGTGSGVLTWWVGKFVLGRLLDIGHTSTDQSVGASVWASMMMLALIAFVTLVTIGLLTIAAVAQVRQRKMRFLRAGLVGIGFLAGSLTAIYAGLYTLTK